TGSRRARSMIGWSPARGAAAVRRPAARSRLGQPHRFSHRGGSTMSILILGGTGFIGRRLVPLLAKRGEEIVCMDINPGTANYAEFGKQVRVIRGDVSQFDDVASAIANAKPSRVINLAYWLGSEHA